MIPSICRVTVDRRLLPGETAQDVLAAITARPGLEDIRLNATIGIGKYRTYTGKVMHHEKFFPAWALPEDDAYVQTALRGLHAAGLQPKIGAYRFCTNAAYSAGVAGVPTIGFGPATEADAHMIDERLRIDDLLTAARGYRGIIEAVLA